MMEKDAIYDAIIYKLEESSQKIQMIQHDSI